MSTSHIPILVALAVIAIQSIGYLWLHRVMLKKIRQLRAGQEEWRKTALRNSETSLSMYGAYQQALQGKKRAVEEMECRLASAGAETAKRAQELAEAQSEVRRLAGNILFLAENKLGVACDEGTLVVRIIPCRDSTPPIAGGESLDQAIESAKTVLRRAKEGLAS